MTAADRLSHSTVGLPYSTPEMLAFAADYSVDMRKLNSDERLKKLFTVRNGESSAIAFSAPNKDEQRRQYDELARNYPAMSAPRARPRDASPERAKKEMSKSKKAARASPEPGPPESSKPEAVESSSEEAEQEKENTPEQNATAAEDKMEIDSDSSDGDSSDGDDDEMEVDGAASEPEQKASDTPAGQDDLDLKDEVDMDEELREMLDAANESSSSVDDEDSMIADEEEEEKEEEEKESSANKDDSDSSDSDDSDDDDALLGEIGAKMGVTDSSGSESPLVASECSVAEDDDDIDIADSVASDDEASEDSESFDAPARERPARERKATQYYNDKDFADDHSEAEDVSRRPRKVLKEVKPNTVNTEFETPVEAVRSLPKNPDSVRMAPTGRRLDLRTVPTIDNYYDNRMQVRALHNMLVECIHWSMRTAIVNEMIKAKMKFLVDKMEDPPFVGELNERLFKLVERWKQDLAKLDKKSSEYTVTNIRIHMASYTEWNFCEETARPGYTRITLQKRAPWAEVPPYYLYYIRSEDLAPFAFARIACYPEQHFYLRTRRCHQNMVEKRTRAGRALPETPDVLFDQLKNSKFVDHQIQVWRFACWASGIQPFPGGDL